MHLARLPTNSNNVAVGVWLAPAGEAQEGFSGDLGDRKWYPGRYSTTGIRIVPQEFQLGWYVLNSRADHRGVSYL
jgi:hypothetical protein